MIGYVFRIAFIAIASCLVALSPPAYANGFRERGIPVKIGNSVLVVTPPRDWNRLDIKPGKFAEVWTLDGETLNDVTFYAGVLPGEPLVRERNKKREPLPKFAKDTLLAEVPELLERTYRAYKKIGTFTLMSTTSEPFLGQRGIGFTYTYLDADELPRKGEARAALVGTKLFMATFDAPRLHYFDRTVKDFHALTSTAQFSPK